MSEQQKDFIFEGNKALFREEHDTEKAGILGQFLNLSENMTAEDFLEEVLEGTVPFEAAKIIGGETALLIQRNVSESPNCLDCVLKTEGENWSFEDALLRLEGLPGKIKVEAVCSQPNRFEGEIVGALGDREFSFYVPFLQFFEDEVKLGKDVPFEFAGLLNKVQKVQPKEFHISTGPLFEMARTQFLNDNPEKSAADFPYVVVRTNGMKILNPTRYCSWHMFQGPVMECSDLLIHGHPFYRLKIQITDGDEDLDLFAYASHKECGDYAPQVGDDICGELWLIGYKEIPDYLRLNP